MHDAWKTRQALQLCENTPVPCSEPIHCRQAKRSQWCKWDAICVRENAYQKHDQQDRPHAPVTPMKRLPYKYWN